MSIDSDWQAWGTRDPYFAVLTNPKYRSVSLTPELKREFFASGKHAVEMVLEKCRNYLDPNFAPQRILDFGCGVGRMAIPFAAVAKEIVAMDIAEAMLSEARRNCADHGCENVTLVLSDDSLSQAPGQFDLVHSGLVLQHVEIPRGRILFKALVDKVRPGGCGVIQLPFAWDVHAETFGVAPPPDPKSQSRWNWKMMLSRVLPRKAIATLPPPGLKPDDPEMRMHFYNLSELMFILEGSGVRHVVSDFTDQAGVIGASISFQKENIRS
jgi:SAM-dependent methyltransferase